MLDLGVVRPGSTIRIPFSTFKAADGTALTMTNFAAADILIYKDGSTTERASTSGFTATTDFDAKTGKQLAVIDLSDNTTSGFFNSGSEYLVAIDAVTVDGGTTGGWIGRFRIGYAGSLIDTTIASLSSQTSFTLTNGPAEDNALVGFNVIIHDIASAVQFSLSIISAYTGSTKTVTLATTPTFTISAGDNISVIQVAPLQPATVGRPIDVDSSGKVILQATQTGVTIPTVTTVTGQLTVAAIATGVWQDATSGDFTAASSIGKSLYTAGVVPGANGGIFIAGSNAATTVNITGNITGTVSTVTTLTNLPAITTNWLTAAGIAADAITAAKIADGAIDRATFAVDTGLQSVRSNTAQAGAASTITLDASASATDNFYRGSVIFLTGGTGGGQYAIITAYVGSTKVATITPSWRTNPDNTTTFSIEPSGMVDLESILFTASTGAAGYVGIDLGHVNAPTTTLNLSGTTIAPTQKVDVDTIKTNPVVNAGTVTFPTGATLASTTNISAGTITTATNLTNLPSIPNNWLTAAGIAASALNGKGDWLLSSGYTAPPTAAANASAVWDEALSGHNTSGTAGLALSSAGSAGDPWTTDLSTYTSGQAGYLVYHNLDAAISSRMATYTQPTGFLSATFPSGTVANTTNITAGTITTTTNLTNLPSIPNNWLTAAGIAASALNGKGDWSTYAGGDTSGTTTLLSRLTGTRAGLLDNLSNLDLAISSLNNLSALCNLFGVSNMEKPDSGSTDYVLTFVVRDSEGKLVDLDSSPTLTATNAAGTDRSANLSAVTHASTGVYTAKYNVTSSATKESIRIVGTGTVSSEARRADFNTAVVDYDSVSLLNTIATQTSASSIATAVLDEVLAGSHNVSGTLGFLAQFIQVIRDGQFTDMNEGLAAWLQAFVRKSNIATAVVSEINQDIGSGSGTYDPSTDSQEALQELAAAVNAKTTNLPGSPAAVGSAMTLSGDLTSTMKTSVTTAATAATPTVTVGDKTGFSLTVTPPTAVQIRQEMDSNSTVFGSITTFIGKWSGATSFTNWLRAIARKGNIDTTTVNEINATTGAGTGDYDPTTDSVQAIRDRGDAAWVTGGGGSAPTAVEIRQEIDSNSTQLAAVKAVVDAVQVKTNHLPGVDILCDADGRLIVDPLKIHWVVVGNVLSVYRSDGTTVSYTKNLTTNSSAVPITGN